LFTRTNSAIRPRTLQHIREEFKKHNVPALRTQMNEREAFRAIFSFGGTLESLDASQVSNRDAAIKNARELASEVISLLRQNTDSSLVQDGESSLAQEVA
jgi:chromosome partitioning protein